MSDNPIEKKNDLKKTTSKVDKPSKIDVSDENLKTLGINIKRFRNLNQKEQKAFLKLHVLEDSILFKPRKHRPRPDPTKTYKTTFRQILDYLWTPYRRLFIMTLILSVVHALLFLALPRFPCYCCITRFLGNNHVCENLFK